MKKTIFSALAAIATLSATVACNREAKGLDPIANTDDETCLNIKLKDGISDFTKAKTYESSSEPTANETKIKDVQLIVFGDDGVEKYLHLTDWEKETAATSGACPVSLKLGQKTVVAIVNGPSVSHLSELSDIQAETANLASYNDPDSTFVMYGEKECTIGKTTNSLEMNVGRLVSKVYISEIKNNLPPQLGNITINYAFLANVVGSAMMNGGSYEDVWFNKYGRINETPLVSSHIIDGDTYKADAKCTFISLADKVINNGDSLAMTKTMYCYPNSKTNTVNAFNTTFSACCTNLVIAATIDGSLYYYTINLNRLEANAVYAVYLTISGLGTEDPSEPVSKGSLQNTLTVTGWQKKAPYQEDI